MTHTITTPETTLSLDEQLAIIDKDERSRVFAWDARLRAGKGERRVDVWFEDLATHFGVTKSAAKARYYAWRKGGIAALIDRRKLPKASQHPACDPRFVRFLQALLEENDRCSSAAFRRLKRMWAERAHIPAYEGHPGWPSLPHGWSQRNLYRKQSEKFERVLIRAGRKSAKKYLPQVLTTRAGLWPGSHFVFDDVWHDNFVRVGTGPVTRVLELGAMDVYSASRFAWGSKPRLRGANGKMESLAESEMRFLLAHVLTHHGFSKRGTVLMVENATAAIREQLEAYLHDVTGGAITVERSGLEHRKELIGWKGRGGGNPNHKSMLESFHNLLHNELGHLPAPTGHDRQQPEASHGLVAYQNSLGKLADKLPPQILARLANPIWDYHTQFVPFINRTYPIINQRTQHQLQGWMDEGLTVEEYTLAPGSEHWLPLDDIPEESHALIRAAAQSEPERWSRCRRMSPQEVFARWERADKQHLRTVQALDIIGADLAKERRVEGSYIEAQDSSIAPEPIIYEARIQLPDGRYQTLPRGETYNTYINPYQPDWLAVTDARGRLVGLAPRLHRASRANDEAVQAAIERAAEYEADLTGPVTARHRGSAQSAERLRQHNKRVKSEGAITAGERDEVRSKSARKAADTRQRNEAQESNPAQMASDYELLSRYGLERDDD